ncbi:MAG TPA: SdrD B-like domain-containing protein [Gallionellaceae bacterium]|nr:SdrD B-like domain-containing protein [Gallionellaceae bacterium]
MKTIKFLVAILVSIAVATCGGGGGGGSSTTPAASTTPTYKISGAVTGTSVQGVTITLSGGSSATRTTNALGAYSFDGLAAGTYTVTPAAPLGSAGHTYSPPSATLTISANTTQDFVSSPDIAYSISGQVSYGGTKTGPIAVRVYSTACLSCSSVGGTAIAAAGPYTVRGLKPGSYVVVAEMYALGTVSPNANNPFGKSGPVSISAANVTGVNLAVADPAVPPQPLTPTSLRVAPGDGSAFVMYSLPKNNFGQEYATSYRIDWSPNLAWTGGGSAIFDGQGDRANFTNFYVLSGLTNGATLYFRMTALVGTMENLQPAVFGPVTIGAAAGSSTVSGRVTFPGAATGPLIVGLYSSTTGVYFTRIANPANPQNYTISGVSNGSYFPFAAIDANSNGVIDSGEISNVNATGGLIRVAGNISGSDIALSQASATASVNTEHYSSPGWNNYNLILGVNDGSKHAVAVRLDSGPNVAVPFDMGANRVISLGSTRPKIGDRYTFTVTYSDNSTEPLSASVTDVLDSFATNMGATGGVTPTFTWAAPASPPASYIYGLTLWGNADQIGWRYPQDFGLPSTTLSALYNVDGKASSSSLTPAHAYNWAVQVRDANGNSAALQSTYTPP